MPKPYRLALDVGATSIGWCALELGSEKLEPAGILRMGVRVFPDGRDPQSGTSLAMDRRLARGARRRRDRFLERRRRLLAALVRLKLVPADGVGRTAQAALDPYALRAAALERALAPLELGRVLFHLNQRRGFRSSRKGGEAPDEAGKIAEGVSRLEDQITAAGVATLGAWLAVRRRRRTPDLRPGEDKALYTVRARLEGAGAKAQYRFYPSRTLAEREFDHIRQAQALHHPAITPQDWDHLRGVIFHQRPLKPVDPGRCTFFPEDMRLAWAHPVAQRFRMVQEVANLRVLARGRPPRKLAPEQRTALLDRLAVKKDLTFTAIASLLGLAEGEVLNLSDERRDRLAGDGTSAALSAKKAFGKLWFGLAPEDQDEVVRRLLETEREDDLLPWLRDRFGLTEDQAKAVSAAPLPEGHCRLGRRAITALLPRMEEQGEDYAKAAAAIGLHHSDLRGTGQGLATLPPYAEVPALERFLSFGTGEEKDQDPFVRIGRIANPTVHIGLNQIRTLVNDLIREYGKPHDIVVELARDLNDSAEDRRKRLREQAENQRANDRRRRQLADLGRPVTGDNLIRLRLYDELPFDGVQRRCVYTGEPIGLTRLFDGDIDIDHILPYSRTLDDSVANRILCVRHANRDKRNQSPWEAYGDGRRAGYDWADILDRVWRLPRNKQWRFQPDAMDRFDDQDRFLERHMNDTRYLSRLARQYLGCLYDLRVEGERVRAMPGTLVGLLRRKWGLNALLALDGEKNRNDQRHHAVDAAVIAILDQGTIQAVQRAAKVAEDKDLDRLLEDFDPRHNWFRDHVRDHLARIVVSVKPDHGVTGRLHEDTNYGILPAARPEDDPEGKRAPYVRAGHTLVYRKGFDTLTPAEVARIRDPLLRGALQTHIASEAIQGRDHRQALQTFVERTDHAWQGLRHVRLTKPEASFEVIRHRRTGAPYRAIVPGDNLCVDVVRLPDGRWMGQAVTLFAAARQAGSGGRLHPPGPDVVMRVYKGDMIRLVQDGRLQVMRVWRLEVANQRLRLAPHQEGGEMDKRHNDPDDPFRWTFASFDTLRRKAARKVVVTPSGRLRDPGPPPDAVSGADPAPSAPALLAPASSAVE
ncbi:CRISPR-associated Csn1 family endonuclease [Nitrospirillum amazonense]|uniref:CRISPR-associated endonuclease Cas9 n=1 Tax=Nitrospirillum amazonense TaxID=28077 RepID=A0A560FBM4_9PROT|nr:type II CRISPR RNA-guided endonuclease Cas9 [Nitrospirillum amazonense]TWB19013.1 CRISPR-associated Csn1 family endonuclease [Nitrospirillum amazonense]